jgi:hypothetical protein
VHSVPSGTLIEESGEDISLTNTAGFVEISASPILVNDGPVQ